MDVNFTLLLLMQHYPVSQQFQIISHGDLSIDADVADFLQAAEQQVSRQALDSVYANASAAIQ